MLKVHFLKWALGTASSRTDHVLRVEEFVQFVLGEEGLLQDQLVDAAVVLQRFPSQA